MSDDEAQAIKRVLQELDGTYTDLQHQITELQERKAEIDKVRHILTSLLPVQDRLNRLLP